MEPFYFDAGDGSLFGCYHEASSPARDCSLVLANSLGHEYVQFHRVYRQLAIMLADAGFPVLRFDFAGCGDSSGDYPEWSLARWSRDIEAASEELRRRSSVSKKAVVGLRVGASIALQNAVRVGNLDSLVLWDPVVDGTAHLEELRTNHGNMLGYAHVIPKPDTGGPPEALGFPLPELVAEEIGALDLLAVKAKPARRVLVIESNESFPQKELCDSLTETGAIVSHQQFSNPHLWVWTEDFGKMHVPRRILQSVVDWFSEEYA